MSWRIESYPPRRVAAFILYHLLIVFVLQIVDDDTGEDSVFEFLKAEGYPMPGGEIFLLNESDDSDAKVRS